jgi:hypothetical protein
MSTLVLLVIILIPLFAFLGIQVGKRRAQAHAHRIEEYRASSESHLLNLRDWFVFVELNTLNQTVVLSQMTHLFAGRRGL